MVSERGIVDWVQKQNVLLTGGTGFLGQALLHKLLKLGCPKIFLLIRVKKNQDPQQRLDALLNTEIFKELHEKDVELKEKIVAIPFDGAIVGLGISDENRQILCHEVTVVFHAAASIKFDDQLKQAILTNVRVTRDVLLLAKEMAKLKVFHYISTAYSNFEPGVKQQIEEKLYEPKIDWRRAIVAAETMPNEELNSLEKKIVGAGPNTYTFTKHVAESLVGDFAKDFPVVISRPSVVTSAYREPSPGWTCNLLNPVAMTYGVGKGVLRLVHASGNSKTAYIHVDHVTNLTIVSTWHKVMKASSATVSVCNDKYEGLSANAISEQGSSALNKNPFTGALWYYNFYAVPNSQLFLLAHLLVHFLPGLFFDALLKITGNDPRLTRIYRKIYMVNVTLHPFMNYPVNIITKNADEIIQSLPTEDDSYFNFDMPSSGGKINEEYEHNTFRGIRAFVKEPLEPSSSDLVHWRRLFWLDRAFKSLLIMLVAWNFPYLWLLSTINCIRESGMDLIGANDF